MRTINLWDAVPVDEIEKKKLQRAGIVVSGNRPVTAQSLTLLSFGAGQDSVALLLLLIRDQAFRQRYAPGRLLVGMSDTGNEHPETYDEVERARAICAENDIPFTFLTPDMGYHTPAWQSLTGQWERNSTVGAKSYPKTCSSNLKIEVIRRWLNKQLADELKVDPYGKGGLKAWAKAHGPIHVIIGYAAKEERRAEKRERAKIKEAQWILDCFEEQYPLIDLGWDRAACQRYITSCGQPIPPPSCCMFCPFKGPVEVLLTKRRYPEQFYKWVQYEKNKLQKWGGPISPTNHGVFKTQTLLEIVAQAEIDYADWSDERLQTHWMSHGHCVET